MITFEQNILYPIEYKCDYIKINTDNGIMEVHYRVTTDSQNSRWFIAVTIVKNGEVSERKDLSGIRYGYNGIIEYIRILPTLIQGKELKHSITDQMQIELTRLIEETDKLKFHLEYFREKYCGKTEEKEIQSDTINQ